jgi:hypothetical protein
MRNTTGGKPIAVRPQSISGARPVIPLVAFYPWKKGRGAFLLFPETTRDYNIVRYIIQILFNNQKIQVTYQLLTAVDTMRGRRQMHFRA